MPQNQSLPARWRGYTIVEILVVVATTVILVTFSYAQISDFRSRQKLTAIARQLDADLNYAQATALAGYKPDVSNCSAPNSVFEGIRFHVDASANSYRLFARCSAGNGPDLLSRVLPADVTLYASQNSIDFYPLTGGTNISAGDSATIGVCGFGSAQGFTVTSNGKVSQDSAFTCP